MNYLKNKRFANGFSLLELLVVIAIMALLSTLAVTSYFGAVRGMAASSAKRHFESTLRLARQRACIDGTRVSLMVFNEIGSYKDNSTTVKDWIPAYVVCKELGRISFVGNNLLYDEFNDLDKLFGVQPLTAEIIDDSKIGDIKLYNLTIGSWTMIRPYVISSTQEGDSTLLYSNATKPISAYAFQGKSASWKVGDAYGVEVTPVQKLPKGFTFASLGENDTAVQYVTFMPDGSAKAGKEFTIIGDEAAGGGRYPFTVSAEGKITPPSL